MGFIKRLQSGWKAMTTVEKWQLVLGTMAQVGGGLIGADIAKVCAPTHSKAGYVCVTVAGFGIGSAIGDAANKAIRGDIADMAEMIGIVKNATNQKEEQANG